MSDPVCRHCHKPILKAPPKTQFHKDRPDCWEAYLDHRRESQRKYRLYGSVAAVERKGARADKVKTRKKCEVCNRNYLPAGFRKTCPACIKRLSKHYNLSGNLLYEAWATDLLE